MLQPSEQLEHFKSVLRVWWFQVWANAMGDFKRIIAIASDLERGQEIQALFERRAFSLPQWNDVLAAIAEEPVLSRQIGHKVGTAIFTADTLTAENIARTFFDEGLKVVFAGDGNPDPAEIFAELAPRVIEYLVRDDIGYEVSIPLIGLACDSTPITLDDTTTIEQRTNQFDPYNYDISQLLREAGERQPLEFDKEEPAHYRSALRIRYVFPKLIDSSEDTDEIRRGFYHDIQMRLRDCLRTLAVVTFLNIIPWPPYVRELSISPRLDKGLRVLSGQHIVYLRNPGAKINSALVEAVRQAWQHLRHVSFSAYPSNVAVGLALDRLASLGQNVNTTSSQIVDAVIACEAFFTLGHSSHKQELSFRAAMAAALLSPSLKIGLRKAVVFYLVKKAYNIRSRVVHGEEIRAKDLFLNGAPWPSTSTEEEILWNFTFYTSELVRRGIAKQMFSSLPGECITIDWDQVFFGDGTGDDISETPNAQDG
jgi:hypothetical protein